MDARLKELELLSAIERSSPFKLGRQSGADRDLAAFLVSNRFVNDLNVQWQHFENPPTGLPGESDLERKLNREHVDTLSKILGGLEVSLYITHSGRVRIAELSQTLRSGKLRDPFGILWDRRHFDVDLRVVQLEASEQTPVAVAYLDLNGLKAINDTRGHDAGDVVLTAYFQDASSALADRGDGYCLGGDEVGLILPRCSREEAVKTICHACLLLQKEHLQFKGEKLSDVSIAAGLAVSSTPVTTSEQLRKAGEDSMYKAKRFTKSLSPRSSSWNISGEDEVHLVDQTP